MHNTRMEDFLADQCAFIGGPGYGALPSYAGDRVRPRKGGGGGNQAWEIENQRNQKAQEAIAEINKIFDSANRDALYGQQRDAVYGMNRQEVERQAREAERANRFAMARNGLLGGSVDIDSNAELNRRTNEGLSQAAGIADAAASDLRAADEQTRSNLVSMAQAGTDATTAGQLANSQLAQNAQAASADRAVASVSDLFGNLSNAYLFQNLSKFANSLGGVNPYAAQAQNKTTADPHSTYAGQTA